MNEKRDSELLRRLTGELTADEKDALDRRLAGDPELADRFRDLQTTWQGLELPPTAAPAPGLSTRLMAQAREIEETRRSADWGHAPLWARAASAFALAAGIVLGVGVTGFETMPVPTPTAETTETVFLEDDFEGLLDEPGLAELYLEAVEAAAWESIEGSES